LPDYVTADCHCLQTNPSLRVTDAVDHDEYGFLIKCLEGGISQFVRVVSKPHAAFDEGKGCICVKEVDTISDPLAVPGQIATFQSSDARAATKRVSELLVERSQQVLVGEPR
jgi:hypothetical protein